MPRQAHYAFIGRQEIDAVTPEWTRSFVGFVVRTKQIHVADVERLRQLVQRNDSRITAAVFQTAQILLAETGKRGNLLLRQSLLLTKAGKVPADKFTHIHAFTSGRLSTISLSTIVCIDRLMAKTGDFARSYKKMCADPATNVPASANSGLNRTLFLPNHH